MADASSETIDAYDAKDPETAEEARLAAERKRHFSMLRTFALADLFTLGNAACGTAAIFLSLNYLDLQAPRYMWVAFGLIPIALIHDAFDGYVARKRQRSSIIGADLDSLADIVSFGVAPATLAFALGMRGGWDMAILIYFVVCGISRLARYNVTAEDLAGATGKVTHYEGTPIPSSIILVVVLAVAFAIGAVHTDLWFGGYRFLGAGFHPLSLMLFLSGSAMISGTLKIPKP